MKKIILCLCLIFLTVTGCQKQGSNSTGGNSGIEIAIDINDENEDHIYLHPEDKGAKLVTENGEEITVTGDIDFTNSGSYNVVLSYADASTGETVEKEKTVFIGNDEQIREYRDTVAAQKASKNKTIVSPLREAFGDASVTEEFKDHVGEYGANCSRINVFYSPNKRYPSAFGGENVDCSLLEFEHHWEGARLGDTGQETLYITLNNGSVLVWCETSVFAGYAAQHNSAGFRISGDGKIEYGSFTDLSQGTYDYIEADWSDSIEQCSNIDIRKFMDLISEIKNMPSMEKIEQIIDPEILTRDIYIMKYGSIEGYEDYMNPPEGSYKIRIVANVVNIRSTPSIPKDNSNKVGTVNKGETYTVYETKNNEGYTWYRIGNDQWIADDGTWTEIVD